MQIDHFGNITYDYPNRNSIYELLNKLLLFQNYLFYKLNNVGSRNFYLRVVGSMENFNLLVVGLENHWGPGGGLPFFLEQPLDDTESIICTC